MAARNRPIDVRDLQGFKYFELVTGLFERLRSHGLERDKAGNRELFFDQYALLMLLDYFNPIVTSLRGLQQATTLEKVQRRCGIKSTALGSLSEAATVFDPKLLEPIIAELAGQVRGAAGTPPRATASLPVREAALAGLIAVDGSLLRALPKMAWALWQTEPQTGRPHRAARMHVAFAVEPAVPVRASVTAGTGSERVEFRRIVEPGGFYVADRGYADYSLFRELDAAGCRFVMRVQQNAAYEVEREHPLSAESHAAGVIRDVMVRRLGTEKHNALLERPLRVVIVQGRRPDQQWVLATNARDLSADLVATAYRYRWQVELFFRWFKCVLGCRHLVSHSRTGVTLQVYFGIIAALLIGLWTGRKPNKRTYEMLCWHLGGWATAAELDNHLLKLQHHTGPPCKT